MAICVKIGAAQKRFCFRFPSSQADRGTGPPTFTPVSTQKVNQPNQPQVNNPNLKRVPTKRLIDKIYLSIQGHAFGFLTFQKAKGKNNRPRLWFS